jgi:hypothetical protein
VEPVEDAMRIGLVPAVPVSESDAAGVELPIPTFPFARTEKRLVFDDDATLKIIELPFAVVDATLKATDDDVAPTPATNPLSWKRPVESVVAPVNRARKPLMPPLTPAPPVIPSDDVATH